MKRLWAVVILIVVLFIPIRSTLCPEWQVEVTDENGRPVEGVRVSVSYANFSAERQMHFADAITDSNGRASFPKQKLTATVAQYLLSTLTHLPALTHAGFGRYGTVSAYDGVRSAYDEYTWSGRSDRVYSRLVLKATQEVEKPAAK